MAYLVTYRYDGADWVVVADAEERCHSFGRTVGQASSAIEDAIALWFRTDDDIELSERFDPGIPQIVPG